MPTNQAPTRLPSPAPTTGRTRSCPGDRGIARPRTQLAAGLVALAVTVGLWLRNGGLADLVGPADEAFLATGRLAGLLAALAALLGLYLAARPRSLERAFGLDRMLGWHRWVGISTVALVAIHVMSELIALSPTGHSYPGQPLVVLMQTKDWMVAAFTAAILFLVIGLTSWRRVRRLIPYETWYFIHLSGYLTVVLAFGHQVTSGSDIAGNPITVAWWILLFVATALAIAVARWGDLGRAGARPRTELTSVGQAGPGLTVLQVSGPGVAKLNATPGQFFLIRILTADHWWQAHPVSMSAAPTSDTLRFTIKHLGDWSTDIGAVPSGTRVILEGPYGRFTTAASEGRPLLLVGGGIGIAPIRALLEDAVPSRPTAVIVRARSAAEAAHLDEITELCRRAGASLHLVIGPRRQLGRRPFTPSELHAVVPDIAQRDLYVCGPRGLEEEVVSAARHLGVPRSRIHRERFRV